MILLFREFSSRSVSDRVAMSIVLLIIVALSPMTVFRYLQGNYPMMIIDFGLIVVACLSLVFLYLNQYGNYIKGIIGVALACGMVLASYYGSDATLYWLFPGTLGIFSMLQPRRALVLLICMSSALLPVLSNKTSLDTIFVLTATLGASIFFVYYFVRELQLRFEQLNTEAIEDYLTQTGNRRAFHRDAEQCISAKLKNQSATALIVFDMDYFKRLNDSYGHGVGDQVLKESTRLMSKRLRRTDKIYRLGGEEFGILMKNCSLDDGLVLARDLREFVAENRSDKLPPYTMSFGVAELSEGESVTDWVERADKALYASKDAGRDKITAAK
ncbi:GGDEF domain-containing protein [Agaribacter flavus]|uniref:diguanylate cyclase n=1 Tax=Agaribacter flavus TaxID=1902781 RepID=A0ABV7FP26_9ALTE